MFGSISSNGFPTGLVKINPNGIPYILKNNANTIFTNVEKINGPKQTHSESPSFHEISLEPSTEIETLKDIGTFPTNKTIKPFCNTWCILSNDTTVQKIPTNKNEGVVFGDIINNNIITLRTNDNINFINIDSQPHFYNIHTTVGFYNAVNASYQFLGIMKNNQENKNEEYFGSQRQYIPNITGNVTTVTGSVYLNPQEEFKIISNVKASCSTYDVGGLNKDLTRSLLTIQQIE